MNADPHEIADKFCQHYAAGSFDSYAALNGITKLNEKLLDMPQYCNNDFSVSDLESLEKWEGFRHGWYVKEHIIFSHPAIIVYLTLLFNIMAFIAVFLIVLVSALSFPLLKTQISGM